MNNLLFILIIIECLALVANYSDDFKLKFQMDFLSQESSVRKSENALEETNLVSLKVLNNIMYLHSANWTINWSSNPTNIANNSFIAVYHYGQASSLRNNIFNITLNNSLAGTAELQTPLEAGSYDIRYIQDNNLKTITSIGPLYLNPTNIILKIEHGKDAVNPGEKVLLNLAISLCNERDILENNFILSLNFIGQYEENLLTKEIKRCEWNEFIEMPDTAGYYIFRLLRYSYDDHYSIKINTLAVSKIIKVSDYNFKIFSSNITSVVASSIAGEWNVNKQSDPMDWIGLFSLNELDLYNDRYPPLNLVKTYGKKHGNLKLLLPPESHAGPHVLVYFYSHRPIAISDLINLEQPKVRCPLKNSTMSKIQHLVVICTENHSFDSYFGNYCKGDTNSNPECNYGQSCCETAPSEVDGHNPFVLDDLQNKLYDPNHDMDCEVCEINNGKMNKYIKGCYCSDPKNFAVADEKTVSLLHGYARKYSLADRYFQPSAGASSQNDMYFARASYVFKDNVKIPVGSIGSNCWYLYHKIPNEYALYYNPTISSLLAKCGFTLKSYAEGYKFAADNFTGNPPYPDGFDPGDIPFNYYAGVIDNPQYITDYSNFRADIIEKKLPEVSFVKPLGNNTGHPQDGKISDEMKFVKETVDMILNSEYYEDTLIIYVPDESGGFFDQKSPPTNNPIDGIPYGPRIPMLTIGKFAKKDYISHVLMEHSSIVKFIEWNWLSGETGHLNTRDKDINGIGSMIDSLQAGINVP